MILGMTLFKCSKCGKVFFTAHNRRFRGGPQLHPRKCTRCGSHCTSPLIGNFTDKIMYEKVWEDMGYDLEEENERQPAR